MPPAAIGHACGVGEGSVGGTTSGGGGEPVAASLSDQTFVAVDPAVVAAEIARPERWRRWWPDLDLEVSRDRGPKGVQWVLTGRIGGTAEIYLEPWHDGTVVHLYQRLRLPAGRRVGRDLRERELSWKRHVTALKDELEGDRAPGTPAQVPPSG